MTVRLIKLKTEIVKCPIGALEKYAARHFLQIKKLTQKLE